MKHILFFIFFAFGCVSTEVYDNLDSETNSYESNQQSILFKKYKQILVEDTEPLLSASPDCISAQETCLAGKRKDLERCLNAMAKSYESIMKGKYPYANTKDAVYEYQNYTSEQHLKNTPRVYWSLISKYPKDCELCERIKMAPSFETAIRNSHNRELTFAFEQAQAEIHHQAVRERQQNADMRANAKSREAAAWNNLGNTVNQMENENRIKNIELKSQPRYQGVPLRDESGRVPVIQPSH